MPFDISQPYSVLANAGGWNGGGDSYVYLQDAVYYLPFAPYDEVTPDTSYTPPSNGSGVPAGGTTGQVLAKASAADGDAEWATAGAGDVLKVGTPVATRLGLWTGDGTLGDDANLSFNTTGDLLTVGAGSLTRAGAHALTFTTTGTTNVTFPTGGTVYTSGGSGADVAVTDGGTGRSTSTTAYGLIAAGTTATGAHQTLAAGATTEILVGGGAAALPVWTTATGTGAPVRASAPTFTSSVTAGAAGGTTGSFALKGTTSGTVTLTVGAAAGTYTLTLPADDGTADQFLKTDGAGALTWSTPAGTGDVVKVGTPANNQVGVWTGDGTIEGDAALTFDTTTDALLIGAGSITRAGAHLATITTTGTTNVTLPTSGTLAVANATATISAATDLDRATHGNRRLIVDTAVTLTVLDDTAGGWGSGDVIYGRNTSAGNVVLAADATGTTNTVTALTGLTLTVPAGYEFALSRDAANAWVGGAQSLTSLGAQPVDSDLTTIAGLTATTDNVIQSVGSAWASRTPAQLKATLAIAEVLIIPVGDETTAITTGTAKVTFRMPFAMTVTAVRASLTTTSSSGIPTFDINDGGTTILSTKLTVDAGELTSTTAAAAAVISDSALADDAQITIDIDVAGTGAAGAKIYLIGTRA